MKIPPSKLNEKNTREEIWMSIENNVYDVTKFLEEHPGGEDVLLEFAGKDATEAFNDVGHSQDAKEELKKYLIGSIVEEPKEETKKYIHSNSVPRKNRNRIVVFHNKM